MRLPLLIGTCAVALSAPVVLADQWRFDPEKAEKKYTFGAVTITQVRDTTKNQQYPTYTIRIERSGELQATYKGIAFEQLFAAKGNDIFLGLSNAGLPGTALVVFAADGSLIREFKHEDFRPDYCEESSTLTKVWFSESDPGVEFRYSKIGDDYEYIDEIFLNTCKGVRMALSDVVAKGHENALKRHKWVQEIRRKERQKDRKE